MKKTARGTRTGKREIKEQKEYQYESDGTTR